jgi:hypothetical protein
VRVQTQLVTHGSVSSNDGYNGLLRQPSRGFRGTAKHSVRHFVHFVVRKHCISRGSRSTKLAHHLSNAARSGECLQCSGTSENRILTSLVCRTSLNTFNQEDTGFFFLSVSDSCSPGHATDNCSFVLLTM